MRRPQLRRVLLVDAVIAAALAGLLLLLAPGLAWVGLVALVALAVVALSFLVQLVVAWRRRRARARSPVRATPPFR